MINCIIKVKVDFMHNDINERFYKEGREHNLNMIINVSSRLSHEIRQVKSSTFYGN